MPETKDAILDLLRPGACHVCTNVCQLAQHTGRSLAAAHVPVSSVPRDNDHRWHLRMVLRHRKYNSYSSRVSSASAVTSPVAMLQVKKEDVTSKKSKASMTGLRGFQCLHFGTKGGI